MQDIVIRSCDELDAIYRFPTLIDIASKKDRQIVLNKDCSYIKYIKLPTEEEQLIVLNRDINNLSYINKPSENVIKEIYRTHPDILDVMDEIPEYLHAYIMDSSIDHMLKLYPSPWKLIKEIIYILWYRRRKNKKRTSSKNNVLKGGDNKH